MIRALPLVALLLTVGCGTSAPPPTMYSLRPPAPPARADAAHDVDLLVRRLEVVDLYSQPQLVYRIGTHGRRVRDDRVWVTLPAEMMSGMLADRLERAGVARNVVRKVGKELPHYELIGVVEAIEEVEGEGAPKAARVAVSLQLVCLRSERVVWEQRFDDERPIAPGQEPPDTLSAIYAAQIDEAARSLAETLANEAPQHTTEARP